MEADLAIRFIESLNHHQVEYCHWKSNLSLAHALAGEEDLDILVDRKTLAKTVTILANLGFKAAVIRSGANVPGIFHYYGLDAETGKLIHVHLFSSVLTGESFVKSHFLPFERMLLENTDYIGKVRVVSKTAELALLVVRTFIKYGSLLDLLRLAGDSESLRTELRWLQAGGDISEAVSLLGKYCPVIDEPLFHQCIEAIQGRSSIVKRMLLARTVRRRLRVYAKYTPLKRLLAYASLVWARLQRQFTKNRKNKTLNSGGAIIAFVGPDATGKSTLVAETGRWLGSVFAVRIVHVGKPPSTWLTVPVNIILPLARRVIPQLRRRSRISTETGPMDPELSQQTNQGPRSLIYAIRAIALAWDRYQLLIKVRHWAANGEIVICDRYPTEITGAMDSPRLSEHSTNSEHQTFLYSWLVRFENRLYARIPPPDTVLRLRVSIETAKQRNRDRKEIGMDAEDYLETRHREAREWYKHGTKYVYDIDTEQSLEETVRSVKEQIWGSL